MKRVVVLCVALLFLLMAGCGKEQALPVDEPEVLVIEDTFSNGLKWGNRFAAEQGDWIAMRGEQEGKVGLMLFHKEETNATFLLEGDVCNIALLGNVIYFQMMEEDTLYAYDVATKECRSLLSDCISYQVRDGQVYYLSAADHGRLQRFDLAQKQTETVKTDNIVDDFWLTDYGIYYRCDEKGTLMVREYGADQEQLIYQNKKKKAQDLVAIEGAKVAFLAAAEDGQSVLCSYHPAENKVVEHLNLAFDHLNVSDGYVVTVENGSHIYAVDVSEDKVYDWGTIDEHRYPQIMSDCLILYQGNRPVFRYYSEK